MQRGAPAPVQKDTIDPLTLRQALGVALEKDDVEEVKNLMRDLEVGQIHEDFLFFAIQHGKTKVAHYLADLPGIQVVNLKGYGGIPWRTNLLVPLYREGDKPLSSDLDLFKKILRAMPVLSVPVPVFDSKSCLVDDIKLAFFPSLVFGKANIDRIAKQFNLIVHEAVFRNDRAVVDSSILHEKTLFNADSFLDYIKDREINPRKLKELEECLDYLASKFILNPAACEKMKVELNKRVVLNIEVESFPPELRAALQEPARPLQELFEDFMQLVFPEAYRIFHGTDKDPTNIWQIIVALDQTELLLMLNKIHSDRNTNPAAALLAQILFFYHKTELGEDKTPLFNKEQIKSWLAVFKNLFSPLGVQKVLLVSYRDSQRLSQALMGETQALRQEVTSLKDTMASMQDMMRQMMTFMQKSPHEEVKASPPPSPRLWQGAGK